MNILAFLSSFLTLIVLLASRSYADAERPRRQGAAPYIGEHQFSNKAIDPGGGQISLKITLDTNVGGLRSSNRQVPNGLPIIDSLDLSNSPRPYGPNYYNAPVRFNSGTLNSWNAGGPIGSVAPIAPVAQVAPYFTSPTVRNDYADPNHYDKDQLDAEISRISALVRDAIPPDNNNFENTGYLETNKKLNSNGVRHSSSIRDTSRGRPSTSGGGYGNSHVYDETDNGREAYRPSGRPASDDRYHSDTSGIENSNDRYQPVSTSSENNNEERYHFLRSKGPTNGDRYNSGSRQSENSNYGSSNDGYRQPSRTTSSSRPSSNDRNNFGSQYGATNSNQERDEEYRPTSNRPIITARPSTIRPSRDDPYNAESHVTTNQHTGNKNNAGGYRPGSSTRPNSNARPPTDDRYNSYENNNNNNNNRANPTPSNNKGTYYEDSGFSEVGIPSDRYNDRGRQPGSGSNQGTNASNDRRRPSNSADGSTSNYGRTSTPRPGYRETTTQNNFYNDDRYETERSTRKPSNNNQKGTQNYNSGTTRRPSSGGRPLNNADNEDFSGPNNSDTSEPERPHRNASTNHNGGNNDSSGETNRPRCSKRNEFLCGTGECLPIRMKCDNRVDCRDSSDEADCVTASDSTTERYRKKNRDSDRNGCVLPSQPDGGTYELGGCDLPCDKEPGDNVPRNSILNYTCREGYVLDGNTISVCVNDEWYKPPSCLKTCTPLSSTTVDITCTYKGSVVSCDESIMPGTRATLACKHSYKLPVTNDPAYREVECLEDGLWNRTIFRCLPECGTATSRGNTLVVNGFDAKIGIFPWHVGIYNKNYHGRYEQICGGTLIANNLVLSAAHCFFDESKNKLRDETNFGVAAGKHYRSWYKSENYQQKAFVEEIELGDRYIGARGNFAQDIALLKLKTPLELTALVRPICLDWDNTYEHAQLRVGQTGKAVGWGKTQEGIASESLQEVNLPFVPYDQCLSAVPTDFRGYITSDKFCAGYLNGSSLCEGDSGGGLCFQMNGIWYLRGIVSVSPVKNDYCDYESYVGFTYVSSFRDWIRSHYVNA
ncbi:uncharacterized protein [Prorops nasuta]|uniref:uncharacterized protein n=1 Tax=Prorops nasuta TaxID=863751 RepID=UPI0034CEE4BB